MIVFVIGLPGTGKTYFSSHFARENGFVHFNTDIIREEIGVKGQYNEETKQSVYHAMEQKVEKEVKKGNDVVVDGTFHKRNRREKFIQLARDLEVPFCIIKMEAGVQTVKKRLEESRKYSDAGWEVYQKLEREFEPVRHKHLKMRSDECSIPEMIQKAKKYIYGKRTGKKNNGSVQRAR